MYFKKIHLYEIVNDEMNHASSIDLRFMGGRDLSFLIMENETCEDPY